jgi:hypothetical protein
MGKNNRTKKNTQKRQQGGEGSADFALKVFGGVNEQKAVSENNNVIAMNPQTSIMKGGNNQYLSLISKTKNQLQSTIKKQLKRLKQQGGSLGFSEFSASPAPSAQPDATADMKVNVQPQLKGGNNGPDVPVTNVAKAFNKVGGKLSKQQLQNFSQQLEKLQQHQQQHGGVGMSEVIVPLILLYASQRYGTGSTAKNNSKHLRRSMRNVRK